MTARLPLLLLLAWLAPQAKPNDNDPATWTWNNPDAVAGTEHGVLKSEAMKTEVGFNVYLPPGYKEGSDRYPVVYFLHGMGGSEKSDAGFSGYVASAIAQKKVPPMIYVFPNGGRASWYLDWAGGKASVETMIAKELIPFVDQTYRTWGTRRGRAVCGFSMGGYGAFHLAFKYPELFSSAASLGGAVSEADRTIEFRHARGTDMEPVYRAGDPHQLAKDNADKIRGKVALRLYVGDKDGTFKSHPGFVELLRSLDLAPDYTVFEGVQHNPGQYYPRMAEEMIEFQAAHFKAGDGGDK
jgi:endo-1,4-beta-xylanase